jgi:hypothetical protein
MKRFRWFEYKSQEFWESLYGAVNLFYVLYNSGPAFTLFWFWFKCVFIVYSFLLCCHLFVLLWSIR